MKNQVNIYDIGKQNIFQWLYIVGQGDIKI